MKVLTLRPGDKVQIGERTLAIESIRPAVRLAVDGVLLDRPLRRNDDFAVGSTLVMVKQTSPRLKLGFYAPAAVRIFALKRGNAVHRLIEQSARPRTVTPGRNLATSPVRSEVTP